MSNITVNMENLSDAERKQLTALIEKANKPKAWAGPSGKWLFGPMAGVWGGDEGPTLIAYNQAGFCAKTKGQAEFIRDQLTNYAWMLHAWLEVVGDWRPDWNYDYDKYAAYYDHGCGKIKITSWSQSEHYNKFYFKTEKDCQRWLDMVGDKLKAQTEG